MAPPFPQTQATKPENHNLSMENLSSYLHQYQQDHTFTALEFQLQQQLDFDTPNIPHHELQPSYPYLGFNPVNHHHHLYQPELFQGNSSTFLASLDEFPQESLTSMVHDYDPFCYFHGGGGGGGGGGGDVYNHEGHCCSEEGLYHCNNNGMVEHLNSEMACKGREGVSKSKSIEKQRRLDFNNKYDALMKLLPNRTKGDRASVVGGAIEYIKELLQTVNHLKLDLNKKKCLKERSKKLKAERDAAETADGSSINLCDDQDQFCNGSLGSSWLQRKSRDTEVDVRVIDDDVTIKLVQPKKSNCLLCVSKILDELQLDVHHVAGGCIGDLNTFMFNTKVYEGASVHASSIANKLIEGVSTNIA